jgi:hypothetical protein
MSQRLIDDGHAKEMERTVEYLSDRIPALIATIYADQQTAPE